MASLLVDAYGLASGDVGAEPAPLGMSGGPLLPWSIPFGPERPGVDKHGHTMHESISERELADLAVAYTAALAWFSAQPALP